MAKGWKCPHCSTENPATTLTCTGCGRIQGSVVVPGSSPVAPVTPTEGHVTPAPWSAGPTPGQPAGTPGAPSEGWQATSTEWSSRAGEPGAVAGGPGSVGGEPAVLAGDAPPATPSWAVNLGNVPPASTPLWRRLPIGWLIVGVLVIAGGIGGYLFSAGRSDSGEINRAGDMTANDLRVGDCFDLKEPDPEEVSDVTARPCSEAHEFEVFYVGAMASGPYPGEEALTSYVVDNCEPAFGTYVGKAYLDSQLDFSWLYPSDDGWNDGDRSIQCVAYDPNDNKLTLSLRGAAR